MAYIYNCLLLLALAAVSLSLSADFAQAKTADVKGMRAALAKGVYPLRRRFTARGCSSFGHSCFGGHGKRADEEFPPAELSAPLASENRAAEVELPAFTLLAGGERERSSERMQQPFAEYRVNEVVPLFKQWLQLQSLRRIAEGNTN